MSQFIVNGPILLFDVADNIAVTLSHRMLWSELAEAGDDVWMIIEDDCLLHPDGWDLIQAVLDQ